MGESYSFPTAHFSPKYPTPQQWWSLLKPLILKRSIMKAMSNAIYDLTVTDTSLEELNWPNIWDCMIGGWMANPAYPKGLKARAALYGRFLQETKNIDFADLLKLAVYAEQDTVVTDEQVQMQLKGFVFRRKLIAHINAKGEIVYIINPLPKEALGKLVIKGENLGQFEKEWINLIEIPVLKSTMRAQKEGFPMDVKYLRSIKKEMDKDLEVLLKDIYRAAGKVINLDSKADLTWLFKHLKISNKFKTPTGKMATGKNVIAKLVNQHSIVQAIANRKKIGTLVSFYFGALDKKGNLKEAGLEHFTNPRDGRIHPMLATIGSITGRNTCANPNLMQVPSRADIYKIKKAFVAPGRETRG
jgi:DNA polymerase I-like protein with 3'-5' exonuclease and polymerase domains